LCRQTKNIFKHPRLLLFFIYLDPEFFQWFGLGSFLAAQAKEKNLTICKNSLPYLTLPYLNGHRANKVNKLVKGFRVYVVQKKWRKC
jgi:hypothetical protein